MLMPDARPYFVDTRTLFINRKSSCGCATHYFILFLSLLFKYMQKFLHFEVLDEYEYASKKRCQKNAILNIGAILNF
jgi:hypothetical protein